MELPRQPENEGQARLSVQVIFANVLTVKPIDQVQTAAAMRDRVTVDLRGMRLQLQAQAARHQMTAAALVRHAVTAMLDNAPSDAGDSRSTDGNCGTQVVKVSRRRASSRDFLRPALRCLCATTPDRHRTTVPRRSLPPDSMSPPQKRRSPS